MARPNVHRPWTKEEEDLLVSTHDNLLVRDQCVKLGRERKDVVAKRSRMVRKGLLSLSTRAYHPNWTASDDEWLQENYHRYTMRTLKRKLRRTENAIVMRKRKLGIHRSDGFYTARLVASLLGISCAKIVVAFVEEGWLKGSRAPYKQGKYRPWVFSEKHLVDFLRAYPFLANQKRMERHWLKSIHQEEWDRNPWYNCKDAAALVGIGDSALQKRLRAGVIQAFQRSPGRRWSRWWIRRDALLANFKRYDTGEAKSAAMSAARKTWLKQRGLPRKVYVVWELTCPKCLAVGRFEVAPRCRGREAEASWLAKHECQRSLEKT